MNFYIFVIGHNTSDLVLPFNRMVVNCFLFVSLS